MIILFGVLFVFIVPAVLVLFRHYMRKAAQRAERVKEQRWLAETAPNRKPARPIYG